MFTQFQRFQDATSKSGLTIIALLVVSVVLLHLIYASGEDDTAFPSFEEPAITQKMLEKRPIDVGLLQGNSSAPSEFGITIAQQYFRTGGDKVTVANDYVTIDHGSNWVSGGRNSNDSVWRIGNPDDLSIGETLETEFNSRTYDMTLQVKWFPASVYNENWTGFVHVAEGHTIGRRGGSEKIIVLIQARSGYVLKALKPQSGAMMYEIIRVVEP